MARVCRPNGDVYGRFDGERFTTSGGGWKYTIVDMGVWDTRILDTYGNLVGTIRDDRVNDTYGNWVGTFVGDKFLDTYGNWVYTID